MRALPRPTSRALGSLVLGATVAGAAWGTGQDDLLWPAVFFIALPLVALLSSLVTRPGFRVERSVSPAVTPVGDTARVHLRFTATRPGFGVDATAWDDPGPLLGAPHLIRLDARHQGATTHAAYPIRPRRRGRHPLARLTVRTGDVLGFWTFSRTAGLATEVVVTPRVHPLPHAGLGVIGETGETPLPRSAQIGPDDATVRDYHPGDDVRRIDWRTTARTGELMVRREEAAWDPAAWLLLDSRAGVHAPAGDTRPTFEWLVDAAASVGERLLEESYALGLVDAAGDVHEAGSDPAVAAARWLEPLVDVDVTGVEDLRAATEALHRRGDGVLVALLGRLDASSVDLLAGLPASRHARIALVIAPEEAHRNQFDHHRAALERHDWDVRTTTPDGDLAAAWLPDRAGAGTRR